MNTKARFAGFMFGMLMLAASPGKAASITYDLDRSNVLADEVAYLQVTVADGASGAIDFTVTVLPGLTNVAAAEPRLFGIQSFAFNVAPDGYAEAANVGNLPEGWTSDDHDRMNGFGFFDIKLYGGGTSDLQTLTFSILDVEGDAPADYAVMSTGAAPDLHSFYAARVADITVPDCTSKCPSSAFVGGNTSSNPVPVPGAAWLFVTGAAAVVARARKRQK